jgi:NodT family efflux transporter outer membrane factor (OMF) lipoprotein
MRFLTFLAFIILFSACQKAFLPVKEKMSVSIAEKFTESSDTNTIASLTWKEFFQDDNLENLIEIAIANNRDLQIAQLRIEKAKMDYLMSRNELLPNIRANITASGDRFGDFTMTGVGNFDTNLSDNISPEQRVATNLTPEFFVGLRSSWEIDIWRKIRSAKKANLARLQATIEYKNLIITELVAAIAMNYYELLTLYAELDIIEKNTQLQKEVFKLIQIQKDAGRVTELAVQQSKAQLLRTQSLEYILKNQIIQTENQINFLAGRMPQKVEISRNFLDAPLLSTIKIGLPAQMLRQRPDIRAAEWEIQAAKMDLRAAQAAFFPSLTLNAYTGFNAFRASVLFNPASLSYGILGGLTAPIFQNAQLKANRQIATLNNYQAYFNYQQIVLKAFQETFTNIRIIENLSKIYELREGEVNELQKAVVTAQDLFVTGYANYLEVITTQKAVLEAELDLFEIRRDQFLAAITLYRALGGGWR